MGWKTNTAIGLAIVGAGVTLLLQRAPGYWFVSDDEVTHAVHAIYDQTAGLRKAIGGELLYVKQIEPDFSVRSDPDYGVYLVHVNESGTIVVRSERYGVVLVFRPLPGGEKTVTWRCRVSPPQYVIEDCEPGGEE